MAMNFPLSPVVGQLFPSPPVAGQPVYQWDGEKWTVLTGGTSPVYIGDVPPGNPPNGALWWNSSNGQLYIYYMDGSSAQWVMIISAQSPQGLPTPNRFVNPAMMVSQEWPLTVVPASGHYPVDGIIYSHSTGGSFNCQQIASPTPGGSPNRIRITTAIADASLAANEVGYFSQRIEGLRVADLMFGSSSAKALMLRLGSKAGTENIDRIGVPPTRARIVGERRSRQSADEFIEIRNVGTIESAGNSQPVVWAFIRLDEHIGETCGVSEQMMDRDLGSTPIHEAWRELG